LISLNTNFDITKCKFQALYVLLESMSLNCTFVENHEMLWTRKYWIIQ